MEALHSWIETIGVLVTAAATIALAWVTAVLARETKRLAAIGQQPQVIATIEPSLRSMIWLDLHLENTGTATAFDVALKFEPSLTLSRGDKIPLQSVPVLKPGQVLSSSFCDFSDIQDKEFSIIVEWARAPKSARRESVSYAFSAKNLEGMSRLGDIPIVEIASSTKKLADELVKLGSNFRKLEVNIYTEDDRAREATEREAWREEMRRRQAPGAPPPVGDETPNT